MTGFNGFMTFLISQGFPFIIEALAIVAILAAFFLKPKLEAFVEKHFSAKEVQVLETLAAQAYAFIERQMKGVSGQRKMQAAIEFVSMIIAKKGIIVSPQEIEAAIERAWYVSEGYMKRAQAVHNDHMAKLTQAAADAAQAQQTIAANQAATTPTQPTA